MSFSSDIKDEIFRKIDNIKDCCISAEAFAENITTAENKKDIDLEYTKYFNIASLDECCIKNLIKGTFLSSGYITDPTTKCRLEVIFKNKSLAEYYINVLSLLDMTPRLSRRTKSKVYVVYLTEADQISTYLTIIEAINATLYFENIRIEKELKNNINRVVNCETANLGKTVKSSLNQIDAIEKIKKSGKMSLMSDKLKAVIEARIENKDASLEELSKIIGISKSGVKHRVDKILEIASKL